VRERHPDRHPGAGQGVLEAVLRRQPGTSPQ
jgi:hypothetical protein